MLLLLEALLLEAPPAPLLPRAASRAAKISRTDLHDGTRRPLQACGGAVRYAATAVQLAVWARRAQCICHVDPNNTARTPKRTHRMAVAYCCGVSSATARQGVMTGSALRAPSCVPHCFATAEPSPMTHIVVPGVRSMLMTCRWVKHFRPAASTVCVAHLVGTLPMTSGQHQNVIWLEVKSTSRNSLRVGTYAPGAQQWAWLGGTLPQMAIILRASSASMDGSSLPIASRAPVRTPALVVLRHSPHTRGSSAACRAQRRHR